MEFRFKKSHSSLAIFSTLLVTILLMPNVAAAQQGRCFQETGMCISGRFERFWERHGGLPVFGYPISVRRNQRNLDTGQTYPTQIFERNRFELHADQAPPYDVMLGRLGVDRLAVLGQDWATFPRATPETPHYFAETGHAIGHDAFWKYWSSHGLSIDSNASFTAGESLALFGYPISEPRMETNSSGDTVLTQWFERARFEDHGSAGVLLGLLGSELSVAQAEPQMSTLMDVTDFNYEQRSVLASEGGTVTWRFVGPSAHRIVDASGMALYDSGAKDPGARFAFTFNHAGSFEFQCLLHPEMLGVVHVPPVASSTIGRRTDTFQVTWSATPAQSGFVFDLQIKRPGDATFDYWLTGQTSPSGYFVPNRGSGNYSFRARLRSLTNNQASLYSPLITITVVT